MEFDYRYGGAELLARVRPLWEKLNLRHLEHSPHFKEYYTSLSFADRIAHLSDATLLHPKEIRVSLAAPMGGPDPIGYCISSFMGPSNGEIESIFIEEDFRSHGIGRRLVSDALAWMEDRGASDIRVSVACGNESAFDFYGGLGFFPKYVILERRPPPSPLPGRPRGKTGSGDR